jgi:hypothetical protein
MVLICCTSQCPPTTFNMACVCVFFFWVGAGGKARRSAYVQIDSHRGPCVPIGAWLSLGRGR